MFTTFLDERIKNNRFILIMYCITTDNVSFIEKSFELFLKENKLPSTIEFHYFRNSPRTRKLFKKFIKTLPITKIYTYNSLYLSTISIYYSAFDYILDSFSLEFKNFDIIPIMDKVGGPKTETQLQKIFSIIAKKHNVKLHKPLRFRNSKQSIFIQITDYLAAIHSKN